MLQLSLVTPSKKLLTDVEVESVFVPAHRGELNILEGHAPLMSTLETGILRYKLPNENKFNLVAISWGYLEVSKDRIAVLAETAETVEEIDVERARAALSKAEKALTSTDLEQGDFKKQQLKLQRAIIRTQLTGGDDMTAAAEKKGH
ncbi:MAG: F0F1 ATP synthase subunit epsilon [Oligoflexia bacterium]|nr:F0F1 ATP synthase subunit epsilon [Oligoflexia bacterium]